ncbi:MAG: DUF1841 family protein [Sulfuriferula sp.]
MQLSTDLVIAGQLGIRAHYQALMEKTRKHYVAKHEIMDFLAEMIWQAQKHDTAFDPVIYFACLDKKK